MRSWCFQEAKKNLGMLLDAALASKPQHVTLPDKSSVVVLSTAEYQRLRQMEESHAPSFSGILLEIPQDDQDFDRPNITPRAF